MGLQVCIYRNDHLCLTLGQNSNVGKLKTLSGALDIMVRTTHAFQLIRKELAEESGQASGEKVLSEWRMYTVSIWGVGCACISL